MKREILIFTVLITNITFASTLAPKTREVREITASKKKIDTLSSLAAMHLRERGLDESAAKQKVLKSLKNDEHTNDLIANNIVKNLNEIKKEDIISYVSDSVLFEKSVDLSTYESLIALVQKNNTMTLDKILLEKINMISVENKNIKSLYSA